MGKTIRKQIFTEDTDKYCRFLSASDVNLQASSAALQAEIETHKKIRDLIQDCREMGRIDRDKLSSLVTASCPDFITMQAFQMFEDNIDNETVEKNFAAAEQESILVNCAGMSCETCWKNYINQMSKILNGSPVDIKQYDGQGGPHGS